MSKPDINGRMIMRSAFSAQQEQARVLSSLALTFEYPVGRLHLLFRQLL
jgi:hypothetical protein